MILHQFNRYAVSHFLSLFIQILKMRRKALLASCTWEVVNNLLHCTTRYGRPQIRLNYSITQGAQILSIQRNKWNQMVALQVCSATSGPELAAENPLYLENPLRLQCII